MTIKKIAKIILWNIPMPSRIRLMLLRAKEQSKDESASLAEIDTTAINRDNCYEYVKQILRIPLKRNNEYVEYKKNVFSKRRVDLIAYYLTQYHPTNENNLWWGKGTTEWTNVTKTIPQYLGHYQPRLAGELGYYDLRITDNIKEQIDIAKNYGVDVFAFYYYWFDGKRVLEKPLNAFLKDDKLNIHFCLCWANENWSRRFSGDNNETIIKLSNNEKEYKRFIEDIIPELKDQRYYRIKNKLVLIIYRPSLIPSCRKVLSYWREYVYNEIREELYIIASQEKGLEINWGEYGFDNCSQFQPASLNDKATVITNNKRLISTEFKGIIYDYKSIVDKSIMLPCKRGMFPAVMPMWDNTPRRNNTATIYDNSSPQSYAQWLEKAIKFVETNNEENERVVFINAWNEWGEGAYLEPDKRFGYAYLQETYNVNCKKDNIPSQRTS